MSSSTGYAYSLFDAEKYTGARDPSTKNKNKKDKKKDGDSNNNNNSNNNNGNNNGNGPEEEVEQYVERKPMNPCARCAIIGTIILIVLGLLILGIFLAVRSTFLNKDIIENCGLLNALGVGLLPIDCSAGGRQYYASQCWKSCPDGYNKTDACRCSKGRTDTNCELWGKPSAPDQCPQGREYYGGGCLLPCEYGAKRTAACTCEIGAPVTDCDRYNKERYAPTICPNGREYFGGMCYKACPPGYKRTAPYTCARGAPDYNPELYNAESYDPVVCKEGREYYAATCVFACPAGYTRTAACSCKYGDIYTDCGAFGLKQSPICDPTKAESGGLCYNACPYNGKRTAIYTCYYSDSTPQTREPDKNCNHPDYPIRQDRICYRKCGSVASDSDLNGGGSVAQIVSCNNPSYPVPGTDTRCYQNWCPNGGQRAGPASCWYGGAVKSIIAIYGCPSGTVYDGFLPGTCYNPDGIVYSEAYPWNGGIHADRYPLNGNLGCDDGRVKGSTDIGFCYDPCPIISNRNGIRMDANRCDYSFIGRGATSFGTTRTCPGDYPINPGDGSCYQYSGQLTFTNYPDFDGGDSQTASLSCPGSHPVRGTDSLCYRFGCPLSYTGQPGERVSNIQCQWACNNQPLSTSASLTCPNSHPLFHTGQCHTAEGTQTSAEVFNGGIGTLPDSCPSAMQLYAGGCYAKCPSGTDRTAVCTCSDRHDITNCTLFGGAISLGLEGGPTCDDQSDYLVGRCYKNKCPPEKKRTTPEICDDTSIITDKDRFGDPKGINDEEGPQCDNDSDLYAGYCYRPKCDPGTDRIAPCTCSNHKIVTNCTLADARFIGDKDGLGPKCLAGRELWAGVCYEQWCPPGKRRTASCTCDDYDEKIDCEKYGDARPIGDPEGLGPRCSPGTDFVAGLCYKQPCPDGYYRRSVCSCQKNGSV